MKPSYKFGLIGHKIGYSRSPSIFEAIFEYLGVDGSFENFDFAPDELQPAFKEKRFAGIDGLSVTIPYKRAVIELLDKIDPVAETLQAVNSIAVREEGTFGANSDWIGFAHPLAQYKEQLREKTAIVFGYGGSAKAVIYSLYQNLNIRKIIVIGRDLPKARENLTKLKSQLDGLTIEYAGELNASFMSELNPAVIVNCSPLGGFNCPDQSPLPFDITLDPTTIYYDLNYNADNQIVTHLRSNGITTIDGSAMLVAQALESLKLWTEDKVPFNPIYEAVFNSR